MRNLLLLFIMVLLTLFSFDSFAIYNNAARISYGLAVARGSVPGARTEHMFVHRADIDTNMETVWSEDFPYVYPSSASVMTVSSADANDNSAGTGLRTLLIKGLDANHLEVEETIILNGQTAVTTVNSYLRLQGNGMIGKSAGSTGSNEGKIYVGTGTVTAGVPANIFNSITIGDNSSHNGFYTIPANQTGFIFEISSSVAANKNISLDIMTRNNGVFITNWGFHLNGQPKETKFTLPEKYVAKTDIEIRALIDTGTGLGQIVFNLLVIK